VDLYVGKLDSDTAAAVTRVLKRKSIPVEANWNDGREKIATISALNLASVTMFTAYVSKLEGLGDSPSAMERTRFSNLPWWMYSYWLPSRVPPLSPNEDWDFFVGSTYDLADQLAEIQRLSDLGLGTAPPGYDLMRSDLRAFFQSNFSLQDDKDIIRWVWKAYWDAVTLSLESKAPIWGAD
jgi:hypothetical protein